VGLVTLIWTDTGKTEEMARAAPLLISDCS